MPLKKFGMSRRHALFRFLHTTLCGFARRWGKSAQSWSTSFALHAVLVVALAYWTFLQRAAQPPLLLVARSTPDAQDTDTLDVIPLEAADVSDAGDARESPYRVREVPLQPPQEEPAEQEIGTVAEIGLEHPRRDMLLAGSGRLSGGGLEGRKPENRSRLAKLNGGSAESERAVRRGLEWLAYHQKSDGSWHFNHALVRPNKVCLNPGNVPSTTGATALALLPFLGAGQTHLEGEYQRVVARGAYALLHRMRQTPHGADLREGTMYAQGLAAIALCELYVMTHDKELKKVAQQAIDFICYAQDNKGGGWRYEPGQPGDTSMHGWQLMALKSGQLGYLDIPREHFVKADAFLDTVQSEYGAKYGYQAPGDGPATTAIGLLCRMYLGWPQDKPELQSGLYHLSKLGPSADNLYYNYYATLALHHYGGEPWKLWNPRMRDFLIETQVKDGPEAGSWYFAGGHGKPGGRLYNTAMAVMTLEVYYRYLPLYRQPPLAEDF